MIVKMHELLGINTYDSYNLDKVFKWLPKHFALDCEVQSTR